VIEGLEEDIPWLFDYAFTGVGAIRIPVLGMAWQVHTT
jgi:hypothetical protein